MKSQSRKGIENKISIDYGLTDYYKFYMSKHAPKFGHITSQDYNTIISEFNLMLVEMIVTEGLDFIIPHQLGIIGVRKYKPVVKLSEHGNLINKLPVNPIETARLWDENPEAKEKKIYIRYTNKHSDGYVFSLYYFRTKAKFKNKDAYYMVYKRSLKRKLAKNIKEKVIDAFLISNIKK